VSSFRRNESPVEHISTEGGHSGQECYGKIIAKQKIIKAEKSFIKIVSAYLLSYTGSGTDYGI
jgi:hypothetical protein